MLCTLTSCKNSVLIVFVLSLIINLRILRVNYFSLEKMQTNIAVSMFSIYNISKNKNKKIFLTNFHLVNSLFGQLIGGFNDIYFLSFLCWNKYINW